MFSAVNVRIHILVLPEAKAEPGSHFYHLMPNRFGYANAWVSSLRSSFIKGELPR